MFNQIGVLGAGSWGTALAVNAQSAGRDVIVWGRDASILASLKAGNGNQRYLPQIELPSIETVNNITALQTCDAILAVIPAQFARGVFETLAPVLKPGTPIALCTKGIEQGSYKLMTDVLSETLPDASPAVLSGPSFARDVAMGLPTAVTLACADEAMGHQWMDSIGRPGFRPYWSDDIVGAEAGGAIKNVLAIACGIVEGLGLGKSAHAALISRGFAEMTRFAVSLGGRPETLAGLCGLGDLVLTCSSPQSRNMSFGYALGKGQTVEAILASRDQVTEGVATAPAVVALSEKLGVEMPISIAVADILSNRASVSEAIERLLSRPFKSEHSV